MRKLLVTLTFAIAFVCVLALSIIGAEFHVTNTTELGSANSLALSNSESDTIYIDADISGGSFLGNSSVTYVLNANWTNVSQYSNAWTVANDSNIAFLANGARRTITFTGNRFQTNGTHPSNSSITYGGINGGDLLVNLSSYSNYFMYDSKDYTINLYNVTFSGYSLNKNDWTFLSAKVLNIYDNVVIENCNNSGGILINATTFNMYGGEIKNNVVTNNMGRMIISGTFNMYGGSIHDNYNINTRTDSYTCHLFQADNANLYAGSIYNNYYEKSGNNSGLIGKQGSTNNVGYAAFGVIGANYEVTDPVIQKIDGIYSLSSGTATESTTAFKGGVVSHSVIFKSPDATIVDAFMIKADGTLQKSASGATTLTVPNAYSVWVINKAHSCAFSITPKFDAQATYYGTNHNISDTIAIRYPNGFTKAGVTGYSCSGIDCEYIEKTEDLEAIFSPNGYSYNTAKTGIDGGYLLNNDALKAYNELNDDIRFGIIIVNPAYLGDSFLDENGKITAKEKALQVEITTTDYSVYSFVINGFTTEYAKSFELVIASYAISNGKAEFIQSEYALSDTPAVSMVEKNDGCLYTVSLNTVVSQNSLEKIPAYTIPTNNKDEE